MKFTSSLLAIALLAALTAPASAGDPATSGALGERANRIAGLWSTQGAVRRCGSALPTATVRNTLVFHAGGTVSENARFPPDGALNVYNVPGINQRSTGLGKWSYDPMPGTYAMHLRFDWYVDGVYHGHQTVEREILLSNDGTQAAGSIRTVRYGLDGSVVAALCGSSVSTRL